MTNWGNAGAVSEQQITAGDGYVEFTASETSTSRMLGLPNGNSNASYTDIDFALMRAEVLEAAARWGVRDRVDADRYILEIVDHAMELLPDVPA